MLGKVVDPFKKPSEEEGSRKAVEVNVNSVMHVVGEELSGEKKKLKGIASLGKRGFKRQPRPMGASGKEQGGLLSDGKKRSRQEAEEMDIDDAREGSLGR